MEPPETPETGITRKLRVMLALQKLVVGNTVSIRFRNRYEIEFDRIFFRKKIFVRDFFFCMIHNLCYFVFQVRIPKCRQN